MFMKARSLIAAALVAAGSSVALVLPQAASAAPRAHHRISIRATPNPALAGDDVVIGGRLSGPANVGRRVLLYHEPALQHVFTLVETTKTIAGGFYGFNRLPGVVDTNRKFFVISDGVVSRVVRERVEALVDLNAPGNTNVTTGVPMVFTGTVDPPHVGGTLLLQRQNAVIGGDDWHTIGHGTIGAGGAFSITHTFVVPGDANIRVLLRPDVLNVRSPSEPISLQISQKQNPNLSINSSVDPIAEGGSTTISGTLTSGASGVLVTLLGHTHTSSGFTPIATAPTTTGGAYSFAPQSPVLNTFYKVQAAASPAVHSAVLFEGVKSVVTATASPTTVMIGQTVTFTGGVTPNKTGHIIYLQRLGKDGDFHTVETGTVGAGSLYTISHQVVDLGTGTDTFRTLVPGGPDNQNGASPTIPITITPNVAPLS
jgi:hypothetical protein